VNGGSKVRVRLVMFDLDRQALSMLDAQGARYTANATCHGEDLRVMIIRNLWGDHVFWLSFNTKRSECQKVVNFNLFLFTPLRGRVRPHQGYKVSYVLLLLLVVVVVVVVVVVAVAPGQPKTSRKHCI